VSAVEPNRAGLASGIANLARIAGAALGVAVGGTVLAVVGGGASDGPAFLSGMRAALLVGAAVELLGAVIAFTRVRNPARAAPEQAWTPESTETTGTAEPSGATGITGADTASRH
jgi:hypothetical protein